MAFLRCAAKAARLEHIVGLDAVAGEPVASLTDDAPALADESAVRDDAGR